MTVLSRIQSLEIENKHLKEQIEKLKTTQHNSKKAEEITDILYKISNTVNTTYNLNELYKEIHTVLGEVIDVTNFYIALYDEHNDTISFPYVVDEVDKTYCTLYDASKSNSLTIRVIFSDQPMLKTRKELENPNKEDHPKFIGCLPESWLGVPLRIKDKVIGALAVQSYTNPDLYQPYDIKLFSAISDYVALAIHRGSVENSLIQSQHQVKLLSKQTEQFSLTAASMLSLKDEQHINEIISSAIVEYSDFKRVLISYFNENEPHRSILGHAGFSDSQLKKIKSNHVTKATFIKILKTGKKLGQMSYFVPHDKFDLFDKELMVTNNGTLPENESDWHPYDLLLVEVNNEKGELIGIISVDEPASGQKPTEDTVRPLEVFSSLSSQIIVYKRSQAELKKTKKEAELANYNLLKTNKELEKAIDHANKMVLFAKTADRYKSEFLANMSHELRTPMQGVLGFASLGKSKAEKIDRKRLRSYFEDIYESGQRLLTLLNDLLDLSKLESGMVNYKFKNHLLSEIIDLTVQEQQPIFVTKSIKLKFQEPPFNSSVYIDDAKMMQVIRNLLSNAVKFSASGSNIEILLKEVPSGIMFRIIDEGIGIPENELEAVFDKFIQSTKSKTNAGGTGLGLSICKQIIKDHSGRIWAENGVRDGTIFSFTLPYPKTNTINM